MGNEQYELYIFCTKAICPVCSGMMSMLGEHGIYRCIDCLSVFTVSDEGKNENFVIGERRSYAGVK